MPLTEQESTSLAYRGFKSVTFSLVLLGFVTGTTLLVFSFIDSIVWRDSVLGLLTGYVVRDGVSKITEAYFTRKISQS